MLAQLCAPVASTPFTHSASGFAPQPHFTMPSFSSPTLPPFPITEDASLRSQFATGATIHDLVNQAIGQMISTIPPLAIEHSWDFLHHNPLTDAYASASLQY